MFLLQAHSDKSRDYTVPDAGILAVPQAPGVPTAGTGWQSGSQMFSGPQAPVSSSQLPGWDPSSHSYASAPVTYPGQTSVPPVPPYPGAGAIPAAAVASPTASQLISQYGMQPTAQHSSGTGATQPPYY